MHNRNSKIYNHIDSKVHFKGLWCKELMNTLLALIALQIMEQHNKKQYYMNNKDLCKHIKHQVSICLSKLIVLQTLMKENRCEGEKIPPKTKNNNKQFMYNVNNRVQCSCVPHTINVSLLYEHGHG